VWRVQTLKQLWGTYSARWIAVHLGMTRNAVIGKAHRLGLERQKTANRPGERQRPHKRKPPPIVVIVPAPLPPDPPKPPPSGVKLVDLERHHCRWPLGEPRDMLFCGQPKWELTSYCPFHVKQAYQRIR
jgi:GcrA cell cycle regulator